MSSKNFPRLLKIICFSSTIIASNVAFANFSTSPELNDSINQKNVEVADSLADFHTDLDEFVITAKKEIIKSDGANLTYDLAEDDSSKGLTLLDALRKVPMITVDGQDNIYINGESNYKVYVNGKEDPMLSANASTVFKSMPAASVCKIEVLTEPGAKYDAEGSAGIINLLTETKQRQDGYSGSLSASLTNQEWYAALFGRMKYDKFSADANIVYSENAFSSQENKSVFETLSLKDEQNYREILEQNQNVDYNFLRGTLNTSWEPNQSNLFTFGGSIQNMAADIRKLGGMTSMYSKEGELRWSNLKKMDGSLKFLSFNANASYQHNFNEKGHRLVFAYLLDFGRNPLSVNSETEDIFNFPTSLPYQIFFQSTYSREHTFQLDYANPFNGEKHKLETGVKAILRYNSAFGFSSYGTSFDDMTPDENNTSNIRQKQNIYAVYTAYSGHFGSWTVGGGLRYEHTDMGITDKLDDKISFTRRLNDLVPNAALTYNFSPASTLRLSYLMRISRPNINQMSPSKLDVLGTVVQEGNPDLKSEHSNRFSLTYSNYGRVLGGNVYLDYKFTSNAIENFNYYTLSDNNESVMHSTYANIGHISNIGLGGFLNINILSHMTLSLNGKVSFITMKSKSPDCSNSGWTGNYGINWNYTGPADIKYTIYGGQNVHMISLQGHSSGWYYYGLGISRDFLKEKNLNISLSASNFLAKYSTYKSYSYSPDYETKNIHHNKQWRVGLAVTWNFGKLRSQTKQTDLQISNDDRTEGGTNKGGGIGI